MNWGLLVPAIALAVAADAPLTEPAKLPSCIISETGLIRVRPYRECVELLPPERIRGTWFVANEESSFLEEGHPLPTVRVIEEGEWPPEIETWLDVGWLRELEILEGVPAPAGEGDTLLYAVELIGRRARHPGQYGHMDASRHLIVVDEMLSVRPVGRVRTRIRFGGLDCWIDECPSVWRSRPSDQP